MLKYQFQICSKSVFLKGDRFRIDLRATFTFELFT